MTKKVKVLVSVLVAVVLLTVGGVATVMAHEEEPPTPERSELRESFLTRVADNLGVSVDELKVAITAAQQEIREAARIRAFDKAVEKGRLTQEEANEIKEWLEQKPEVLDQGLLWRARISQALRGRQMIAVHKGWHQPGSPWLAD